MQEFLKKKLSEISMNCLIVAIEFLCSDVVCQIVDGRNPLLFKCDDLVS